MVITIIFFESAIELIPESLRNHPLVRKDWKTTTRKKNRGILLDTAIHSSLMMQLAEKEKRGRPDIIYYSLLNLLYSPLMAEKKIEIIIHTYTDQCIRIPPQWRIPVNYNRFVGLFSQLLFKKRIPVEGEAILTSFRSPIKELIQHYIQQRIILLEKPKGNSSVVKSLESLVDEDIVFLIGGFQSGEPSFIANTEFKSYSDFHQISFYKETKPAWTISSRLIHMLEDQLLR